jgi:hypothetical protein
MAVDASIITSIANVPPVVMACVGLYLLAFDLHYVLSVCAALSLAYWCSALWVGWTLSKFAGSGLVPRACARRGGDAAVVVTVSSRTRCAAHLHPHPSLPCG